MKYNRKRKKFRIFSKVNFPKIKEDLKQIKINMIKLISQNINIEKMSDEEYYFIFPSIYMD